MAPQPPSQQQPAQPSSQATSATSATVTDLLSAATTSAASPRTRRLAYGLAILVAAIAAACALILADPGQPGSTQQLLDGIYCHRENCYDVLGMTRQSTRSEISKAYRVLAKQFHPDRQRGDAAERDAAEEQFKRVATAYEILKEDESRADYDYMLDNPQEYYAHYYR